MSDLPPPIPAATLILMRPGRAGSEVLMMERAHNMAFAAGALVFPGGRIDPDDELVAEGIDPAMEDGAARLAAIRETIEETGLAPAVSPSPRGALLAQMRQELEEGAPFSELLEGHGLKLDLHALTPFARWCPTFKEARRFDTLFFLAEAPADAALPSAQEAEAVRTLWATPQQVLDDAAAGRARIIFPTRRNLERLARFASFEEACADAKSHPVQKVVPWIEERGGEKWLCIPQGIGYPVTAELLETARRT